MELNLTFLTDNLVDRGAGLKGEHGLSLWLQKGATRLLFDVGQTGLFLDNARLLKVDLSAPYDVVLSHGHYDHGGGLAPLLKASPPRKFIAHPDVFTSKYARRAGAAPRFIGLDIKPEVVSNYTELQLASQSVDLGDGLMTTGVIPREVDFEPANPEFWTKQEGDWFPDNLYDDQALLAYTPKGLVVILGCAHSGVVNTLQHALRITGEKKIYALVGGFHLGGASGARIGQTVDALRALDIQSIAACHCTGFQAKAALYSAFGPRFVNVSVGLSLTF